LDDKKREFLASRGKSARILYVKGLVR